MKTPLIINGQDFAPIATSIRYLKEVTYDQVITTMDGTEHAIGRHIRPSLEFELMLTPARSGADYAALSAHPLIVTYDDPDTGPQDGRLFRLDCNLDRAFAIRNCVDGQDYFQSGTIRLRGQEVL